MSTLSAAQRAALSATLQSVPRQWREARDRAMALLVLSARLRPAEVAALRLEQARAFAEDRWNPDGRERRTRLARAALDAWLACRAALGITGESTFARTELGTPCSASDAYRAVRRVLRRAGIDAAQIGRLDVSPCVRRTQRYRFALDGRGVRPPAP